MATASVAMQRRHRSAVDAVFLKLGDYSQGFNVLAGDYNNDGVVTILDSTLVRNRMPQYAGTSYIMIFLPTWTAMGISTRWI